MPTIVTQLPAQLSVPEGETRPLAVQASSPDGSALSYRWLLDGQVSGAAGTGASTTVPATGFRLSYPAQTWQAEVTNASGTVQSQVTTVTRTNRSWVDTGLAHADHDQAQVGGEGQLLSFIDPAGRVHVASAHSRNQASPTSAITFKGHSKDSDADTWGYSTAIATLDNGTVSHITMASTWMGEVVASWLETATVGGVERRIVRAALYRPGANAAQAGTWSLIGTVSDAAQAASQPTAINIGAGAFAFAYLQRSAANQPRDALVRTYVVPAAGSEAGSGLGTAFAMESVPSDIGRLQVVDGGGVAMALLYLEAATGVTARWQYSYGTGGSQWTAPADLAVDHRFERIHWANPVGGATVLGTADANGRLFVRRVDLNTRSFTDTTWSYRANAYGSPPAMLIDASGRVDIFGTSVNTTGGNSSVIAHWTFEPGAGWSSANILVQSSTDYMQGLGLRSPVAGRDDAGNLVLAWTERPATGQPQLLRAMRYSSLSVGWSNPVDVASAPTDQRLPALSVNGSGRATAAWAEREIGNTERVRHARLR